MTDLRIYIDKEYFDKNRKKLINNDDLEDKCYFLDKETDKINEINMSIDSTLHFSFDLEKELYVGMSFDEYEVKNILEEIIRNKPELLDSFLPEIFSYATKKFNKMKSAFESIK